MRSRLSPGDSLVLVSDGVPEAMNRAQQLFGRGRVAPMLAAMPASLTAEERVNAVNSEIRQYSEGTEQSDDITVLVVRWHGPQRATSDE
jgi:serine phosphatase RsbU (regulator of sigma subunit)